MQKGDDYNYIIKIIHYLNEKHKISFFITSSDFDVLYSWWIKRIPESILYESIDNVVQRWAKKRRNIEGFKNFSYEARKNFNNFMELKVSSNENESDNSDETNEVTDFLNSLPDKLLALKDDLLLLSSEEIKERKLVILNEISSQLLELHENDPDLKLKTKKFLMNLNKEIRTVEMEKRYQLNYIFSKYKFPEVLLSFSDADDVG